MIRVGTITGGDMTRWPYDDVLHAWWVRPGRLLAGEYPSSLSADKAVRKVRLLVDAGIDTTVDLTEPNELEPYVDALQSAAAERGREIRHVRFPIPDNHVIDHDDYDEILAFLNDEFASGRTVYLHCVGVVRAAPARWSAVC